MEPQKNWTDWLVGGGWIVIISGLYAALQAGIPTVWPESPPQTVNAIMGALGIVMLFVKFMAQKPPEVEGPPDGAAGTTRGGSGITPPIFRRSLTRALFK